MGQGGETQLRDALSQARGTFDIFEANALYEAAVQAHIFTTALSLRLPQLSRERCFDPDRGLAKETRSPW